MTRHSRRAFTGMMATGWGALSAQEAASPGQLLTPAGSENAVAPHSLLSLAESRAAEMLHRQILDLAHPGRGGYMDTYGLVSPQSGAGVIATLGAVWMCRESKYYRDRTVADRMGLAASYLDRAQLPSGNIDLLSTNFNSPPDTGFVVHSVAPLAILAKRAGETSILQKLMPFLRRAGTAIAVGGVHTPNHRWVVCAALALLNHLEPNPDFPRRIARWLAEGIDIDDDGLYTERSPLVYTPVVNRSLIYMAEFLNRPDLLEPVRRSLQAALWLMHPNGELVTELSGRQDQNTVGSMGVNWLALRYLGEREGNGVFAELGNRYQSEYGSLLQWLLLPMLQRTATTAESAPTTYEKDFHGASVMRYRDGALSATLLYRGYDRILAIRKGDAVMEALRFASAFFGKGQFIAQEAVREGNRFTLRQQMEASYFQPLDPARTIPSDPSAWAASRGRRIRSEVAKLEQICRVDREGDKFTVDISVSGTSHVPVSIELNVRDGVEIEGVRTAPMSADSFLTTGRPLVLRSGRDAFTVQAPAAVHGYTLLRGARPKLPGRSVYVTGLSPFQATLVFS